MKNLDISFFVCICFRYFGDCFVQNYFLAESFRYIMKGTMNNLPNQYINLIPKILMNDIDDEFPRNSYLNILRLNLQIFIQEILLARLKLG